MDAAAARRDAVPGCGSSVVSLSTRKAWYDAFRPPDNDARGRQRDESGFLRMWDGLIAYYRVERCSRTGARLNLEGREKACACACRLPVSCDIRYSHWIVRTHRRIPTTRRNRHEGRGSSAPPLSLSLSLETPKLATKGRRSYFNFEITFKMRRRSRSSSAAEEHQVMNKCVFQAPATPRIESFERVGLA